MFIVYVFVKPENTSDRIVDKWLCFEIENFTNNMTFGELINKACRIHQIIIDVTRDEEHWKEISKDDTAMVKGADNIKALLALGNIDHGKTIFKKCAACHSVSKSGGNKIGPALWGVLGRQAGSISNYKYSKAKAAHGKLWSFKEMNEFLTKPKDWIKGTKMSFLGLKKETERAAVILYMNKNTDNPLPLQ